MVRAVLKKRVSRKTRLKFWVEYERRLTRLRKHAKLNRIFFFFHVWNLLPHILEGSNEIWSQKKPIFWKIYTGVAP